MVQKASKTSSDSPAIRNPAASLRGGRSTVATAEDPQRSLALRVLGLVTDVRRSEAPLALALGANVFLLLTAYYLIKPVREALILALDSGAEYKSWMSAAIAVALVVLVPAYARLVDRLPRLRLVVGVTLFFASHLVAFFAASQFEALRASLGLVFYVWVGVFNMMVVAQLWSFATDLFDSERGKRLLPLVALGASLGAALGSKIAAWLVLPLGVHALLLVSAALLVACAFLFVLAERFAVALGAEHPAEARKRASQTRPSGAGAFGLVVRHRYLLAVALFTLAFSWANSNGEYLFGRLVKASADEAVANGTLAKSDVGVYIGRTYADFFFAVNVLGVVLQAFVASRVVRFGGLALALGVLPFVSLLSSVAALAVPALAVVRIGKTLENASDYSLNNTARQLLWLPTTAEMKFKAKQAIDTFFVRTGDVSSALLVLLGSGVLGWSVRGFAAVNVVLAALGLGLSFWVVREGRRLAPEEPAKSELATLTPAPRRAAA
jgi:AAA family ATP:ADP antiporter